MTLSIMPSLTALGIATMFHETGTAAIYVVSGVLGKGLQDNGGKHLVVKGEQRV